MPTPLSCMDLGMVSDIFCLILDPLSSVSDRDLRDRKKKQDAPLFSSSSLRICSGAYPRRLANNLRHPANPHRASQISSASTGPGQGVGKWSRWSATHWRPTRLTSTRIGQTAGRGGGGAVTACPVSEKSKKSLRPRCNCRTVVGLATFESPSIVASGCLRISKV